MGFSGISLWQLLIVLVIVLLLFGTKKLRGLGSDLGSAVKGFKGAMSEGEKEAAGKDKAAEADKDPSQLAQEDSNAQGRVIDAEVSEKKSETKV